MSYQKSIPTLMVVLFSFGFVLLCLMPKKPVVVTFDLKQVRSQLIRQLAEHQVSDEKAVVATQIFKRRLNETLATYAKKHHQIIIDKTYVLAGATDITPQIMTLLSTSAARSI